MAVVSCAASTCGGLFSECFLNMRIKPKLGFKAAIWHCKAMHHIIDVTLQFDIQKQQASEALHTHESSKVQPGDAHPLLAQVQACDIAAMPCKLNGVPAPPVNADHLLAAKPEIQVFPRGSGCQHTHILTNRLT